MTPSLISLVIHWIQHFGLIFWIVVLRYHVERHNSIAKAEWNVHIMDYILVQNACTLHLDQHIVFQLMHQWNVPYILAIGPVWFRFSPSRFSGEQDYRESNILWWARWKKSKCLGSWLSSSGSGLHHHCLPNRAQSSLRFRRRRAVSFRFPRPRAPSPPRRPS